MNQHQRVLKRKPLNNPSVFFPLNDYDPAIKVSSTGQLILRKDEITKLVQETVFTEPELQHLLVVFSYFTEHHTGLNLTGFTALFAALYNFESPFLQEIFD